MRFLIDVVEWTWTLIALIGVLACAWALVDSYLDRMALQKAETNGEAALMINLNLRSTRAATLLHTFFLILGLLALRGANPPLSWIYVLLASGYILVAATNVRAVLLNQVDRVRMRRRG